MEIYYPSLLTSAIFFGATVVKMRDKDYRSALFLCLFAVPSIIFLAYLSKKNLDIIAYVLILVPIILLYIGYSIGIQKQPSTTTTTTTTTTITPSATPIIPDRIHTYSGTDICDVCKKISCKCKKNLI